MRAISVPGVILVVVILLSSGCSSISETAGATSDSTFYMPGQFERQDAVWLGWQGWEPYYAVNVAMIRALKPHVPVKIVCESDSVLQVCRDYLAKENVSSDGIRFHVMENNEFWMRDHGAAFVVNRRGEMRGVDFVWVTYGYRQWLVKLFDYDTTRVNAVFSKSAASKRGHVDSLVCVAESIPVIKSWIAIEGGAIEVNGKGTLLLNEPLTLDRNRGASRDSIETEMKRVLGVRNVIWLQHGLADDPHIWQQISARYVGLGTGGHTDEFVKFADANTILLAWVPEEEKDANEVNAINYERMKINYDILMAARDQDGKPFRIVKVPLPPTVVREITLSKPGEWDTPYNVPVSAFPKSLGWKAGDTVLRVAASSYMNYYVTNGLVLLPDYSTLGTRYAARQKEVEAVFREVFPGRELVFINALPLNWEGGGIHCGTQQQPARVGVLQ